MSIRDKILNSKDVKTEIVKVKEWDVEVEVRGMISGDRLKMVSECTNTKTGKVDMSKMYNTMILKCTYEPGTDNKIFQPGDMNMLSAKASAPIETIAKAIMKLSGFDEESQEEIIKK